jgi:hypothetical protein
MARASDSRPTIPASMVFDSRNDRVNGLAVVDVEPLASRDLEPARVEAELLEDRGVDVRHVVPGEKDIQCKPSALSTWY